MESREQQISECDLSSHQLQKEISSSIQLLSTTDFAHAFNKQLASLNSMLSPFFHDFKFFILKQATSDDTWKFWIQFVFQDAMAYIGLYLAVRSGDWQLIASMKMMAPIFTAFDHPSYQRLITQHLADITSMPPAIMAILKQGAFSVSISGRPWYSVGIDEAHEMLINKACKTSILRPTQDYINHITHYIPYRTKTHLENVECNFFPESTPPYKNITSPYSLHPHIHLTLTI